MSDQAHTARSSLIEIFSILSRNFSLTVEMTRRDIVDQFAGQVLGVFWAIAHPLFLMGLYVFVFSVVFKTRMGGTFELPLDYTAYILSGLVPWLSCQAAIMKSTGVLVAHANLVKQVVFPIEILPVKVVLSAFVPELIGLGVLLLYVMATHGVPPPTYLLLPLLIALQFVALLGLGFLLAAIGTFLRDTKDVIQVLVSAGIYLMPVVYLPDWIPAPYNLVLYLNPFSYVIWCFQDALYFGRLEHPLAWIVLSAGSFALLVGGYSLFRRLKPHFGDML